MTELEDVWRRKSDEQVLEAVGALNEYSADGQNVIRSEFLRRGLVEPPQSPLNLDSVLEVSRLHRRFAALVGAQWLSFLLLVVLLPSRSLPALALLCLLVFLISCVWAPIAGYRLLKGLEVESPGRTALFMYAPLFSLLTLAGMRTFNRHWGREHHVDVGILGPTKEALERLAESDRVAP